MLANHNDIERRLWDAADQLRANSRLKSSEYSVPVLGLIFLRYADHRFADAEKALAGRSTGRRTIGKADYQARGVLFLPEAARFSALLRLPEGADAGRAINDAMRAIEAENDELKDVLPKSYNRLDNDTLIALLKTFASVPMDIEGDAFGNIYEYFVGKFAMTEGQKGGEFFTPTSLVRLIVEVIEPFHGRIFDPACGSGGMFVQSARFVERHRRNPNAEISVYGQEKVAETVRLCKMNLAVHGLAGDVRQCNTYYEDPHRSLDRFDFVMANPPFNVDKVDKERLKDDRRYPFGLPRADNANTLWIQQFFSALAPAGRAGFVMANSASDARASEMEIRRSLIQTGAVDAMIAIGPNFFYTVTLPCTLWFLDRGKAHTDRRDRVLFIDARPIFRQIDRAHREFTPPQIEFLANVVRLYRGEPVETGAGSQPPEALADDPPPSAPTPGPAIAPQTSPLSVQTLHATSQAATSQPLPGNALSAAPPAAAAPTGAPDLRATFPTGAYRDVPGLCKAATLAEIEAQGWSLNPGRYVGVADRPAEDYDFRERLQALHEELEVLNAQAHALEATIAENVERLLGETA